MRSERSRLTRLPTRQRAERGAGQRLGRGVGGEPVRADLGGGEAAAGTGDRGADGDGLAVSGQGAAMTRRMSWPLPSGVMARTVPSAVTMPVNMRNTC